MDQADKKKLIQRIRNLPTLPHVFHAIIATIDNPHSSAADLQETIINDQSVAAKVLSVANSAYFGYTKRISDITRAIVVMGFDAVKTVALSVSIYRLSQVESAAGLPKEPFWLHSIGAAHAAKLLAQRIGYRNAEEAFILGLMHDLGKVILDNYFPSEYVRVMEAVRAEGWTIREAEEQVIGLDHSDAGGWLAERWSFPGFLQAAMQFHHHPSAAPEGTHTAAALAHAADYLVRRVGLGHGGDALPRALDDQAPRLMGVGPAQIEGTVAELEHQQSNVEEFWMAMRD